MEWLNYHHLFYFWIIARERSISKAAERLFLTHPTLSAQLKSLEAFLGEPLFERRGRRLQLTPFGAQMEDYASEIFRLGAELVDVARGRSPSRRTVFKVGVVASLPRTVVYRLLEPVMDSQPPVQVLLRQAPLESLLEMLAANRVHAVLSDSASPGPVRCRVKLLGESGLLLHGRPALVRKYRKGFPESLEGAPLLLPGRNSSLRGALDRWLADRDLHPEIVGEIDDAGLLRVFGAFGRGLFPIRSVLKEEVEETHDVSLLGELEGLKEKYYVFTLDRRGRHPLVEELLAAKGLPLLSSGRKDPGSRKKRR